MAEQCGLAPKSIYNETIVIKQLFKWATKNGYLSRNLLELIHFAKIKSPKQPCFTIDQVELLLRDDLILFNPFDRLRGNATEPDKNWKDAFKVLRKNCETDRAQKYPQYAVSNWIGHNIQVSARHYLQVPAELYSKVVATKETQTGTKKRN